MIKLKHVLLCGLIVFLFECATSQLVSADTGTLYDILEKVSGSQDQNHPKWILIVDLSNESASKIISLPSDFPVAAGVDSMEQLIKLVSDLGTESRGRWVSKKGDILKIYVIHPEKITANIHIDESRRDTRLIGDIKTLLETIGSALNKNKRMAARQQRGELILSTQSYTLTKVRSNLSVVVNGQKDQEIEIEYYVGIVSVNMITGPMEHWYLSADYPVNSVSQLKYNQETGTIEKVDKDSKFLFGVNYQLGDILSDHWNVSDFWQGFSVKLLAEASNHPSDTLAVGFGYRVPPIRVYGFSLEAFSPFVAYSRVKNDVIRSNLSVDEGGKTKWKWIAGISLNLDKVVDWIASSSDQKN